MATVVESQQTRCAICDVRLNHLYCVCALYVCVSKHPTYGVNDISFANTFDRYPLFRCSCLAINKGQRLFCLLINKGRGMLQHNNPCGGLYDYQMHMRRSRYLSIIYE